MEPLPKKSDLKKCLIDVNGGETEGVVVVTNAKHISAGWRVIVALENAVVPAGSDPEEDTNVTIVKKSVVVIFALFNFVLSIDYKCFSSGWSQE